MASHFSVVQLKSNNPFCWHLSEIQKLLIFAALSHYRGRSIKMGAKETWCRCQPIRLQLSLNKGALNHESWKPIGCLFLRVPAPPKKNWSYLTIQICVVLYNIDCFCSKNNCANLIFVLLIILKVGIAILPTGYAINAWWVQVRMESAGAGAQGGGIRWEYPFKEGKKKTDLDWPCCNVAPGAAPGPHSSGVL